MKVKSLLFGMAIASLIGIIIPYVLTVINTSLQLPVINNPGLRFFGIVLGAIAAIVIIHSFFLFKIVGKGTPVPIEPPTKFVIRGLYKYTRNPMYLAYMGIFLAEFFIYWHILLFLYFLLSIPLINLFVVKIEEPALTKRFGQEYTSYTQRVARWIIKTRKKDS